MAYTNWQATDKHCVRCGCSHVMFRYYEPYDESTVDCEYKCMECEYTWWVDGIDS